MIRFARFNNGGQRAAINPQNVTTVLANGSTCKVFTAETAEPMTVAGSFDEVVAALESATAPPVAAAVEVANMERAATILQALADGSASGPMSWRPIDLALGLTPGPAWSPTSDALRVLAAKLRGGG